MPRISEKNEHRRLPQWFRRSLPSVSCEMTHRVLRDRRLTTVCQEALCPNQNECFSRRVATFMILGDTCTRSCSFCSVTAGIPVQPDKDEPDRISLAVRELGLTYVVITSVTRDDLEDEGSGHFAQVILRLHRDDPNVSVEVLTPDFHNREDCIRRVVEAGPVVYNHNLEVVERLQRIVRPQADYVRSLAVLETVKNLSPNMLTKSGLMLGMGETLDEVRSAARDLRSAGCDLLTVGQYLPPTRLHERPSDFIPPQVFDQLAEEFKAFGFKQVFAGPLVRSSYHAKETFCPSA